MKALQRKHVQNQERTYMPARKLTSDHTPHTQGRCWCPAFYPFPKDWASLGQKVLSSCWIRSRPCVSLNSGYLSKGLYLLAAGASSLNQSMEFLQVVNLPAHPALLAVPSGCNPLPPMELQTVPGPHGSISSSQDKGELPSLAHSVWGQRPAARRSG